MIYILVIILVIALDRVVKYYIATNMNPGDTLSVIGDFFHIPSLRNTGAAFSLMAGHSTVLIAIPAICILAAIIYVFVKRHEIKPLLAWAISFICAGGLGNLYDRIMYGYVVDMFDFGSFPVFNVADIAGCVGCGLLILHIAIGDKDER